MNDPTKTTMLRIELAKLLKKRYGTTMNKVLRVIDKYKPNTLAQIDSLFPKIGKVLDINNKKVNTLLGSYMGKSFKKGLNKTQLNINARSKQNINLGFNLKHQKALNNVLRMGFTDVKNVNDSIKNDLRRSLYDAMNNGEGIKGAKERIIASFKKKPKKELKAFQKDSRLTPEYRAELIARTSIIKSYNEAAVEQLKQLGIKKKKWIAKMDKSTCEICKGLNNQVVGIDDQFEFKEKKYNTAPVHPNCKCMIIGVLKQGGR